MHQLTHSVFRNWSQQRNHASKVGMLLPPFSHMLSLCWWRSCQGDMKPWNWVTNMWEVGHPLPFSRWTCMNCEEMRLLWGLCIVFAEASPPRCRTSLSVDFWYFEVKRRQARACLTRVLRGVMFLCLDKPSGGWRVRWSVSVTACRPPSAPPRLPSPFVWKPHVCWALMLACWRLQPPTFHTTISRAQGSKAIDVSWMGDIVFQKKQQQCCWQSSVYVVIWRSSACGST